MQPIPKNKPQFHGQLPEGELRLLEMEYNVAFADYQANFTQAWQTFSVVSTLALAGLAFIGQIKANVHTTPTWPATVAVGTAMLTILLGWRALAGRWWGYAAVALFRMRQIESQTGLYLFRLSDWRRKPLHKNQITALNDQDRHQYEMIYKELPSFPNYSWRQQTLATLMVSALMVIWILYMVADFLALV